MVLGKKVAIFDWEWGGNSAPREGQKMPCLLFSCWVMPLFFSLQILLSKKIFHNFHQSANKLYQDHTQHFIRPDLGPNCLQRLAAVMY